MEMTWEDADSKPIKKFMEDWASLCSRPPTPRTNLEKAFNQWVSERPVTYRVASILNGAYFFSHGSSFLPDYIKSICVYMVLVEHFALLTHLLTEGESNDTVCMCIGNPELLHALDYLTGSI